MTTEATENQSDEMDHNLTALEPTAAEKAQKATNDLLLAMQEEKVNCWKEIQAALDKGNFHFSVEMTISDQKGVRYSIDLIKKK
jgi:hypothetical protein